MIKKVSACVTVCAMLLLQSTAILALAGGRDTGPEGPMDFGNLSDGTGLSSDIHPAMSAGLTVHGRQGGSVSVSVDDIAVGTRTVGLNAGLPGSGTVLYVKDTPADFSFTGQAGMPALPQKSFLVALPDGKMPAISGLKYSSQTIGLDAPLLASSGAVGDDGNAQDSLTAMTVSQSALVDDYPATVVAIGNVGSAGGLRIATVVVSPVRALAPETIEVCSGIGFRVVFKDAPEAFCGADARSRISAFGDTVRKYVVNPWHTPPMEYPGGLAAVSGTEGRAGARAAEHAPMFKVKLPRGGGIVKISGTQLQDAGATLAGLDPATVKVLFTGENLLPTDRVLGPRPLTEVPCLVDDGGDGSFGTGDSVVFYAMAPDRWDFGPGSYILNKYIDDYVYWLTWGNEAGTRMAQFDASGATNGAVSSYNETVHYEKDLVYNPSLTTDDQSAGYSFNRGMWSDLLATSAPYGSLVAIVTQAGNPAWTGYSVDAKVRPLNAPGNAYLMFRIRAPRDYYVFEFGAGGYTIVKSTPTWVRRVLAWSDASVYPMSQNVEYTVRVLANGGSINCYVNGVPVVSYVDSTPIANGSIGFDMDWWQKWEFDDVVVRDLSNSVLFSEDFESYNVGDRAAPTWQRVHVPYNHSSPLVGNWSRMTVRLNGADKVLRSHTDSLDLPVPLSDVDSTGNATLKVRFTGNKENGKSASRVLVSVNGFQVADESWDTNSGIPVKAAHTGTGVFSGTRLQSGQNVLRFDLPQTGGDVWQEVCLDWFELSSWRMANVSGSQLRVNYDSSVHGTDLRIGTAGTAGALVLDVTNLMSPSVAKNVGVSGNNLLVRIQGKNRGDIAVADAGGYLSPVSITPMPAPSWMEYPASVPATGKQLYAVIAYPDFLAAANNLSSYRKGRGWETMVISVEDIYDIFGGGQKDDVAIRNCLAYIYNRPDTRLSHVLLMGDSEFIPPHYSKHTIFSCEIPSDFYYAVLDDDNGNGLVNEDDNVPDIVIARMGIKSNYEANQIITKVQSYETVTNQPWQRKVFLTEGFDSSQANWIGDSFNIINSTYLVPNKMQATMMFRHLLPGESVGLAKQYNRENISAGCWITNYAGHGGYGNWQTFDKEDLALLANPNALTIDANFACDTGWLDNPTYNSLIEDFTLIKGKGGVAGLGASRSSTAADYNSIQLNFYKAIFTSNAGDFGSMVTLTKALAGSQDYYRGELYILNTDPAVEVVGLQDMTVTGAGLRPVRAGATHVESGEPARMWVEVFNRGRAPTDSAVFAVLKLTKSGGAAVTEVNLSAGIVQGRTRVVLETDINTSNMAAGTYYINATVTLANPDSEMSILNQWLDVPAFIVSGQSGKTIGRASPYSGVVVLGHYVDYLAPDGTTVERELFNGTDDTAAAAASYPGAPTVLLGRSNDTLLFQYGYRDIGTVSVKNGTRTLLGPQDLVGIPCTGPEHVCWAQKDPRGYRVVVYNTTSGNSSSVLLAQYHSPLVALGDRHVFYTVEDPFTFQRSVVARTLANDSLGPQTAVSGAKEGIHLLSARGMAVSWADSSGIFHVQMSSGQQTVAGNSGNTGKGALALSVSDRAFAWIDGTTIAGTGTTRMTVAFLANKTVMSFGGTNSVQHSLDQDGEVLAYRSDRDGTSEMTVELIRLVERHDVKLEQTTSLVQLMPGNGATVNFTIANVGNMPEALGIQMWPPAPEGWNVSLTGGNGLCFLMPGRSDTMTLTAEAPALGLANDSYHPAFYLNSSSSGIRKTADVLFDVGEVFDTGASGDPSAVVVASGEEFTVPVQMRNDGNSPREFVVTVGAVFGYITPPPEKYILSHRSVLQVNSSIRVPVTDRTRFDELNFRISSDGGNGSGLWEFVKPVTVFVLDAQIIPNVEIRPGATGQLTVTVPNRANFSFVAQVEVTGPSGWALSASNISVSPGENASGNVSVTVPANAPWTTETVSVKVFNRFGTVKFSAQVNVSRMRNLTLTAENGRAIAGNSTGVNVTVENFGNGQESVKLAVEDIPPGWKARVVKLNFRLDAGMSGTTTVEMETPREANGTYTLKLRLLDGTDGMANASFRVVVAPINVTPPMPPPPPPPIPPPPQDRFSIGQAAPFIAVGIIAAVAVGLALYMRSRRKINGPAPRMQNEPLPAAVLPSPEGPSPPPAPPGQNH